MKRALFFALLILASSPALAQERPTSICVQTKIAGLPVPSCVPVDANNPLPVTGGGGQSSPIIGKSSTAPATATIGTAGVYVQLLPANATRSGATFQYKGASGKVGTWATGASQPATNAPGYDLSPGQPVSLGSGPVVETGPIWVTSNNAGDVFVVTQQ